MLHLINWSHLPDLDLAVKQKQGWLQWKWVGSEMAKCPQTCQSSLIHHNWKQREKRVCILLFSPFSMWSPPSSVNEWNLYPQTSQKSGNKLIQKKKLTCRKHKNWVKLLNEEWKLRFEFIPKETKHNSLSQHSKEKKKKSGWKVLGSCLLQRRQEKIIKEFMKLNILCSQWHIWLSIRAAGRLTHPQISHLTMHLLLCWIAAAFGGKQICHSFSKYKLLLKKMLYWNFKRQNEPFITSIRVTLGQAAALWVEGLKENSIL